MTPSEVVYRPKPRTLAVLRNVAIAGGVLFLVGLVTAPVEAWIGFLIAFNYLVGLGLAGGLFVAILHLSGARWATVLRRIPEAMCGSLKGAAALGVVLVLGIGVLYEWSDADVVEHDELLQMKQPWLNTAAFVIRMAIYFLLWLWVSARILRTTNRYGELDEREYRRRNLRSSALFMVVFAVTFSLATFDWIMSVQPHWFSTIFALRSATGLVSAGVAVVTMIAVMLHDSGPLRGVVTREHFHDLGKLLFSLSVLWVYIWYCQYMLIWYGNVPEETHYYIQRSTTLWKTLTLVSLILNWGAPFLILLLRPAKRSPAVLLRVCLVILIGRAFDLYLMIAPPLLGGRPTLGLWEIGPTVGAICLFFLLTLRGLSRRSLIPAGDPTLTESLRHHA